MDEHRSYPDHLGRNSDAPQRIDDQSTTQTSTLRRPIDAESSQDHYRLVIATGALHHPARGVGRRDAAGGKRVVTSQPTVRLVEITHHVHAGKPGTVSLQGMPDQPVGLCMRAAVESRHDVRRRQRLDGGELATHLPVPVSRSSRTVGSRRSSRRPATSPGGRVSASSNARHSRSSRTNTRRSARTSAAASVAAASTNVETLAPAAALAASSNAFCSASRRRCIRSAFALIQIIVRTMYATCNRATGG
jgi:hypothetical protein